MATFALDGDFEFVARRHDRASTHRELPHRHAWPVVQAKHRVHREFLEQAVFDHFSSAAATFFGGLKNQHHGAVEVAVLGQVLCGGQQHGGVTIVTAGVHFPGVATGMGKGVGLLDWQGIHVGTQTNAALAVAVSDDPHHPRGSHAPVHLNAPLGEFGGHQVRGALLLETQFGVGVDVAAQGHQAGGFGGNGVEQFHVSHLCVA